MSACSAVCGAARKRGSVAQYLQLFHASKYFSEENSMLVHRVVSMTAVFAMIAGLAISQGSSSGSGSSGSGTSGSGSSGSGSSMSGSGSSGSSMSGSGSSGMGSSGSTGNTTSSLAT